MINFDQKIQELTKNLRPGQDKLAQWTSGKMAVTAVPGAGKSHSLAVAGALTIARQKLNNYRQLMIVTYTRSATASIKEKIINNLNYLQLPPVGFSVQTIHSLALNIASKYPQLSGIDLNNSRLFFPTSNHHLITATIDNWVKDNPSLYQTLIEGLEDFAGEESERLRRQGIVIKDILPNFVKTVIAEVKSSGLTAENLANYAHYSKDYYQLISIASGLYHHYQALTKERNLITYDDMILGALRVLKNPEARKIEQKLIYGVFEDEAQDSSPLQGELLTILASDYDNPHLEPNLVRVGDPNQAINSTFTSADPIYFNHFCDQCALSNRLVTIPQAGRSALTIIKAGNRALEYINQIRNDDNTDSLTELPFRHQFIEPVGKNDPQKNANPQPMGKGVEIVYTDHLYDTVEKIGQKIEDLFNTKDDKNNSLAILVRERKQGKFLLNHLSYLRDKIGIEVRLIDDKTNYSYVPEEILGLLQFLDTPHSEESFLQCLKILQEREIIFLENIDFISGYAEQLFESDPLKTEINQQEEKAKKLLIMLLQAKMQINSYRLIPYLAMVLNYNRGELATSHKLNQKIEQEIMGKVSLKSMISTLKNIINNETFDSIEADENEDNPESIYTRKGQVTIMTMHKSKGLDWDYVFLPFLIEKMIPGELFISKTRAFIGDFDLVEIAKAQLRYLIHQDKLNGKIEGYLDNKEAWQQANTLKKNEEYRLLYVAMTRAKKLLWMGAELESPFSWSFFEDNGNTTNFKASPSCPVLPILKKEL
ncbi:MAG: ATP-dependent helicase [Cyanobacterium sp. T60_A2020_053]|nr:ATP-dependent helicase [Cyanobacterium sp. T60_A2020_053]